MITQGGLPFGFSDAFMVKIVRTHLCAGYLYIQGHVYLNSHNNNSSFLFDSGIRGEIGQRVHSHSQAVYWW